MSREQRYNRRIAIKQRGSGFLQMVDKLGFTESKYSGEHHKKGYNYLGPGTRLDKREIGGPDSIPINKIDAIAKVHDYAYKKINEMPISNKSKIEMAHDADDIFINNLKTVEGPKFDAILAGKLIMLKKFAEKAGILDPSTFSVQSGTGFDMLNSRGVDLLTNYRDPAYRLRKKMQQRGGFAIMPLLIPIISSLAVDGITFLIKKLFKNKDKDKMEDPIKNIIEKMDNMPTTSQINLIHDAVLQK